MNAAKMNAVLSHITHRIQPPLVGPCGSQPTIHLQLNETVRWLIFILANSTHLPKTTCLREPYNKVTVLWACQNIFQSP